VTSFLRIKVCVFLENDKTDLHQIFFQGLGENTCLLQPTLKSTAPGLLRWIGSSLFEKVYDITDDSNTYLHGFIGLDFKEWRIESGAGYGYAKRIPFVTVPGTVNTNVKRLFRYTFPNRYC